MIQLGGSRAMESLRLSIVIALFLSGTLAIPKQGVEQKEQVSLSGTQLAFFETALAEARRNGLDTLAYRVSLRQTNETFVVSFEDPDISPTQRGSSPRTSSFEVEMDATRGIVRAHFSR